MNRKIEDFSLHVMRNYALILGVGLTVVGYGEVLGRAATSNTQQLLYSISGLVVAFLITGLALLYVFDREAYNRQHEQEVSFSGARSFATLISALIGTWMILLIVALYAFEVRPTPLRRVHHG